jgi:hypothetical protein
MTREVNDVSADQNLPPERIAMEAMRSQVIPNHPFGVG